MAAPTVRATSGLATTATGATLAATSVGTPVPGETRIVFLSVGSAVTVPASWTTLYNGTQGSATLVVAYREFVSGDGSVTFSFSGGPAYCFLGATIGGVDESTLVSAVDGGASSTTLVAPSATPVTSESLLLTFHAVIRTASASTTTLSTPTGMTLSRAVNPTGSTGHVATMSTLAVTGTSATGTQTSTASGAGTWRAASVLLASVPATAPTMKSDFELFMDA